MTMNDPPAPELTDAGELRDARIAELEARLDAFEKRLWGDPERLERYKTAKANNVWPNIDPPRPGELELATAAIDTLRKEVARHDAFLAPAIASKEPPLDAVQIATRAFVDESLQRLSDALRKRIDAVDNDRARLRTEFDRQMGAGGSIWVRIEEVLHRAQELHEVMQRRLFDLDAARRAELSTVVDAVGQLGKRVDKLRKRVKRALELVKKGRRQIERLGAGW